MLDTKLRAMSLFSYSSVYLSSTGLVFSVVILLGCDHRCFLGLADALANVAAAVGCATSAHLLLCSLEGCEIVVVADLGARRDILRCKNTDTHFAVQEPLFDLAVW